MLDDIAAIHAVVRGRVQGVGFRDFVEMRARSLRLTGIVRNLPEGSLEVIAEGRRGSLAQLIKRLREGPRSSRVEAVDVRWGDATGEYRDFRAAFR